MLKSIAYIVMTGGLLLTSVTASAMPETDSPFPKDNSTNALTAQPVILAEGDGGKSPFPPGTDALPAQPVILAEGDGGKS
ncbi:MAG: hypothetical protein HY322_06130, partial [Betaproteobacteria bacterium]|nr:hypothetical protein [Betaproteobacteria bacterium]